LDALESISSDKTSNVHTPFNFFLITDLKLILLLFLPIEEIHFNEVFAIILPIPLDINLILWDSLLLSSSFFIHLHEDL
jgi:hypothetical protein